MPTRGSRNAGQWRTPVPFIFAGCTQSGQGSPCRRGHGRAAPLPGVAPWGFSWVTGPCPPAPQQRPTTPCPTEPTNSRKVYPLPPPLVSVPRHNPPINRIPQAVQLVEKAAISRARPTWGLDEALVSVPGVYAANRYNFSLDQRISIRGFGARAQFAVRGIKVLVDGIPQTLPDGTGQLTNLELGESDRIEVLRGSSPAGRSRPRPTWGGTRAPTIPAP